MAAAGRVLGLLAIVVSCVAPSSWASWQENVRPIVNVQLLGQSSLVSFVAHCSRCRTRSTSSSPAWPRRPVVSRFPSPTELLLYRVFVFICWRFSVLLLGRSPRRLPVCAPRRPSSGSVTEFFAVVLAGRRGFAVDYRVLVEVYRVFRSITLDASDFPCRLPSFSRPFWPFGNVFSRLPSFGGGVPSFSVDYTRCQRLPVPFTEFLGSVTEFFAAVLAVWRRCLVDYRVLMVVYRVFRSIEPDPAAFRTVYRVLVERYRVFRSLLCYGWLAVPLGEW